MSKAMPPRERSAISRSGSREDHRGSLSGDGSLDGRRDVHGVVGRSEVGPAPDVATSRSTRGV